MGSSSRRLLNQPTHSSVAYSTSKLRQGLSEFYARGRLSSSDDEPFAEDQGELGLCLRPLARRRFHSAAAFEDEV